MAYVNSVTNGMIDSTSINIVGTAGAGFLSIAPQSSAAPTPAAGVTQYVDNSNNIAYKMADGFVRTLSIPATANTTYTIPNNSASANIVTTVGNSSIVGTLTATNISGTNTGNVSLVAVGAVPNANGASLTGQVLTLQPADVNYPGVMTVAAQEFGGVKTLTSPVIKGIHGTTLVDRYVTVDAAGQLGTNTGGSSPPLPVITQMIYVNKGGNDTTGNGSELAPYLTVSKAVSMVVDATNVKIYGVNIGPGIYTEDVNIKPNMFLLGAGRQLTKIHGNFGNDDVAWTYVPPVDEYSKTGIRDLYIFNDGPQESVIDMARHSSNYTQFYIDDCEGNPNGIRFTVGATTTDNIFSIFGGYWTDIYNNGGEVYTRSVEMGHFIISAAVQTCFQQLLGCNVGTVNVSTGAIRSRCQIFGGFVFSVASFTGSDNIVDVTVGSVREYNVGLYGGATLRLLSSANRLQYVPTVPANWSTAPTQVAQALDLLALTKFSSRSYSADVQRATGTIVSGTVNGAAGTILAGDIQLGTTIWGQIVDKICTLTFPLINVTAETGAATNTFSIVNPSPAFPTPLNDSYCIAILWNNSAVDISGYASITTGGLISFYTLANLIPNWGLSGSISLSYRIA
jgi:hypothetical protein